MQERASKKPIAVRACDACRRRKTRCSNSTGSASCQYCASVGIPCTYEPIKRGLPPDALLPSRITSLENDIRIETEKLRRLCSGTGIDLVSYLDDVDWTEEVGSNPARTIEVEQVVRKVWSAKIISGAKQGTDSPGSVGGVASPASISNQEGSGHMARDDQTIDPLEEEVASNKIHYIGRGSGQLFAKAVIRDYVNGFPLEEIDEISQSLVEEVLEMQHVAATTTDDLPPPDLLKKLIDAYFEYWNEEQMPLLHRPSFDRAIQANMHQTNSSFRGLVFTICALSSRWVDDPRIQHTRSGGPATGTVETSSSGFNWFKLGVVARQPTSPLIALVPSSLFDIQSSVLSMFWMMPYMTGATTWLGVGRAIAKAIDVGCQRELRNRWTRSPLEDQLRKRAFHMLYILDRLISTSLGRPFAIQDDEVDLSYPLDISDTDLDEWNLRGPKSTPPAPPESPSIIPMIETCSRLLQIHGLIAKAIYGGERLTDPQKCSAVVAELNTRLSTWLCSMPPQFVWDPDKLEPRFFVASAILYIGYYYAQTMIHRDFMAPSRANLIEYCLFNSVVICANSTRSIAHIIRIAMDRGRLKEMFWMAPFHVAMAAMSLLGIVIHQGAAGATPTQGTTSDLRACRSALEVMRPTNLIAYLCLYHFERMLSAALTRHPHLGPYLDMTPSASNTPSPASGPSSSISPKNTAAPQEASREATSSATGSAFSSSSSTDSYPAKTTSVRRATSVKGPAAERKNKKKMRESVQLPFTTTELNQRLFSGDMTIQCSGTPKLSSTPNTAANSLPVNIPTGNVFPHMLALQQQFPDRIQSSSAQVPYPSSSSNLGFTPAPYTYDPTLDLTSSSSQPMSSQWQIPSTTPPSSMLTASVTPTQSRMNLIDPFESFTWDGMQYADSGPLDHSFMMDSAIGNDAGGATNLMPLDLFGIANDLNLTFSGLATDQQPQQQQSRQHPF